jgi:hypothetical protein
MYVAIISNSRLSLRLRRLIPIPRGEWRNPRLRFLALQSSELCGSSSSCGHGVGAYCGSAGSPGKALKRGAKGVSGKSKTTFKKKSDGRKSRPLSKKANSSGGDGGHTSGVQKATKKRKVWLVYLHCCSVCNGSLALWHAHSFPFAVGTLCCHGN